MKKKLMMFVLFCASFAFALPLFADPVLSDPYSSQYTVELVAQDLGFAHGVAIGATGDIFVSTNEGPIFRIDKVTYAKTEYIFKNASGVPVQYSMNLAFDNSGNLFVLWGDGNPRRLNKITSLDNLTYSEIAQGDNTVGLAVGPDGYIYLGNTEDGTISRVSPSGGTVQILLTGFQHPRGICFDGAGNLYIVESDTGKIYKAPPYYTGTSVVAILGWGPTFITADSAGALYVSTVSPSPTIYRISGGTVTTFATGFRTALAPYGLAFDADGSLFVADGPYLWKFSPICGSDLEKRVEALEAKVQALMDQNEALQQRIDNLETLIENHSHNYLTGKGAGHNDTLATTGSPIFPAAPEPNTKGK